MIILPIIRLPVLTAVEIALDKFIENQIFKKRTFHIVQVYLILLTDSKQ